MPSKFLGKLIFNFQKIERNFSQFLRNQSLFYEVQCLESPFNIERDVEIRTPKQVMIKKDCTIKRRTIINGRSKICDYGISLGENTYLKENCYFDAYGGYIKVGGFCAFGQNTIIHGGGGVEIGKYVITGANCYIIASNHKFNSLDLPIMLQGDTRKGITIGDNVWIGGSTVILDGVHIANNCVIGAGTILTSDVPKNTLVYNQKLLKINSIFR